MTKLSHRIMARYVRLNVLKYSGPAPCLRFQLYGCGLAFPTTPAATTQPLTTKIVVNIITEGKPPTEAQHFHHTTRKPFVHVCLKSNGGCQHVCRKDGRKAICECNEGFQLEEDGRTCVKGEILAGLLHQACISRSSARLSPNQPT